MDEETKNPLRSRRFWALLIATAATWLPPSLQAIIGTDVQNAIVTLALTLVAYFQTQPQQPWRLKAPPSGTNVFLAIILAVGLLGACTTLDKLLTKDRIDMLVDGAVETVEALKADKDGDGEPDFNIAEIDNPILRQSAVSACQLLASYLSGQLTVGDETVPVEIADERREKILIAAEGVCEVLEVILTPAPVVAPAPAPAPSA